MMSRRKTPLAAPVCSARGVGCTSPLSRKARVDLGLTGAAANEIGPVIAFVASRLNSYMTGANIDDDGGRHFA